MNNPLKTTASFVREARKHPKKADQRARVYLQCLRIIAMLKPDKWPEEVAPQLAELVEACAEYQTFLLALQKEHVKKARLSTEMANELARLLEGVRD
jgi:hypothetical protein